ncbi:hypothetical protein K503DRAFT_768544 [Rhizopogon vinicolor AM-OR11-026]|uniref:Uncharacterized protein n=1 Tax=Rhizopogon vinicolor AM-OR11-026 TaxID=1314800 RepID=A0A1B7N6K5_9AGAM|nr:hypothetical protein K503DRAFT_768544 [Rhizopogon vinicolor AM-OR11-026]
MRPASTPTLRSPHLDPLPNDLPVGVEQIGLGFSPMEPIASRSKSVYRSAIRACQNLVPAIRRKISRQSLRKQEQSTSTSVDSNSIQDAMGVTHEIYDPTWASGVESSPATNTPSATTFESEEPVTPETPCFDHTVGIVQHNTFSTLRLVPSSGLQLST